MSVDVHPSFHFHDEQKDQDAASGVISMPITVVPNERSAAVPPLYYFNLLECQSDTECAVNHDLIPIVIQVGVYIIAHVYYNSFTLIFSILMPLQYGASSSI